MTYLQIIATIISILLGICNLCIMGYVFSKFVTRPHSTLESRVTTLEVKVGEIDNSLKQGNDRFREQNEINEVIIGIILSFVDFEVAYCIHTGYEHDEDLKDIKSKLKAYLAKKKV